MKSDPSKAHAQGASLLPLGLLVVLGLSLVIMQGRPLAALLHSTPTWKAFQTSLTHPGVLSQPFQVNSQLLFAPHGQAAMHHATQSAVQSVATAGGSSQL
jgi:hypothetical protein